MFDISALEAAPAVVALAGAVLGWSLRPMFLRYRRATIAGVAVLAVVTAAAATAFDAFDVKPTPEERAPDVVQAPRVHASPSSAPSAAPAFPAEPWADYLERAGRDAFAERDYSSAVRYWREASRMSPRHAAALEGAIAGAQELAAARR